MSSFSRFLMACMLAFGAAPGSALPLPPPNDDVLQQQQAFFRALPKQFPDSDLSKFAPYVSADLKVYRSGELAFSNRDQWFAYLQSFGPVRPGGPRGITVSREEFYASRDGDIVVLEFSWPIPPEGKEGQISYHQDYDFQLVTYRLVDGILSRIEYSKKLTRYDQWLKDDLTVPRSK